MFLVCVFVTTSSLVFGKKRRVGGCEFMGAHNVNSKKIRGEKERCTGNLDVGVLRITPWRVR